MIQTALRNFRRFLFGIAFAGGLLAAGASQAGPTWYEGGLFGKSAVKGYDVVAYFTDGKPVEGKSDFSYEWGGTTWRFASAEHRDMFKADPGKYAPQYGGFCAWAVSQGYTAKIEPEAWKIVDGKLYLNYSKDVQEQWQQDVPGNITKADTNWPGIKKELEAK